MVSFSGPPVGRKWITPSIQAEEEVDIVVAKLSGGINTYIDPADIKDEQVTEATNMRIVGDSIFQRAGTSDDTFVEQGDPPNENAITHIANFARFDGSSVFVRFDDTEIWRRLSSSWEEITGPGQDLITRQKTLAVNDRFFFATGRDQIQEFDFATDTYDVLGNAPKARYICSLFNRIVAANLYDATNPNPILIMWSGDLNFSEWDASVDPSAGFLSLVSGQSDYSDEITGLFGFADTILVCRQRSLWTGVRQPVATQPFVFSASYPNVGADTPDAIAQTANGITWYDYRSNQVYSYEIGGAPVPIGYAIRNELKDLITDNTTMQASYDPIGNRFNLCIPPTTSDTSTIYVFNFETASWTKDTMFKVNGVWPIDEQSENLMIDDLTGVIDDLVGMIDDLLDIFVSPSVITYGLTDGTLLQDDPAVDTDNGQTVSKVLTSKVFANNKDNISVTTLKFKYDVIRAGSIVISFSRNGGRTYEQYKTLNFTINDVGIRKLVTCYKNITTAEYRWKITSEVGSCNILEYRVTATQSTTTRKI